MSDPRTTPTGIEIVGTESVIVRWEDGHVSEFPSGLLRAACPCASCAGEPPPIQVKVEVGQSLPLLPQKARAGVYPNDIEPVGYYAVRIEWSDGHDTGIYSFPYLRSICPCAECTKNRG